MGTGECRSLEMGVAGKNYESHVNRSRGWTNECIGYHINGNIFDAFTANSIIEIGDTQNKHVSTDVKKCDIFSRVLLRLFSEPEIPV